MQREGAPPLVYACPAVTRGAVAWRLLPDLSAPAMRRLFVLLPALLLLPACDSDDPSDGPEAGDQELITRVEITLTNTADASDVVTLTADDENGDGVGIEYGPREALSAGTMYSGTIRLLDVPNGENVTEEIQGDADAHLFAYSSSLPDVTITLTDSESDYSDDEQGFEDYAVGLTFDVTVEAGASGDGTLSVILYHFEEGDEKESSIDTSDDTDVELAFPISVE